MALNLGVLIAILLRFEPVSGTANAAITWPQNVIGEEYDLAVAAQVYGDVISSSMP
jgi:hypothetical protein